MQGLSCKNALTCPVQESNAICIIFMRNNKRTVLTFRFQGDFKLVLLFMDKCSSPTDARDDETEECV